MWVSTSSVNDLTEHTLFYIVITFTTSCIVLVMVMAAPPGSSIAGHGVSRLVGRVEMMRQFGLLFRHAQQDHEQPCVRCSKALQPANTFVYQNGNSRRGTGIACIW